MEAALWIVLGVVLAVAEIFTTAFLVIFLAVGALAAAGAAALGAPLLIQVLVFAVVSGASVAGLRPIIMQHRRPAIETGETPFGIEATKGSPATVIEPVDDERGLVRIDGELWTARSLDGEPYEPGEIVRVVDVQGATAIVWRDETTNL